MGNKIGTYRIADYDLAVKTFWCTACNGAHFFDDQRWKWNGDLQKPTVTPSLKTQMGGYDICHLMIYNGTITYQPDSTHKLAGKTVIMEDYE